MNAFPRLGEQESPQNRARVVRMAMIYTPITVFSLALVALATYKMATGDGGFAFMFIMFGILALLTGFQTVGFLKDLRRKPIEYQGEVVKKWHKGNLFIFFMPSFYLAVDSRSLIGRVTRVQEDGIYVSMENGAEGFIPRKELAAEPGESVQQTAGIGDQIRYKVLGVDKRGNYRLSSRKVEESEYVTKLFTVSKIDYAMLLEHDIVRVTCYPHSSTVERVDRYDEIEKKFLPAAHGADA